MCCSLARTTFARAGVPMACSFAPNRNQSKTFGRTVARSRTFARRVGCGRPLRQALKKICVILQDPFRPSSLPSCCTIPVTLLSCKAIGLGYEGRRSRPSATFQTEPPLSFLSSRRQQQRCKIQRTLPRASQDFETALTLTLEFVTTTCWRGESRKRA